MGNTEGSRVIPQTYKARKNLSLHMLKQQLSVVLGSVLGDAYIYPQGKICFEQGIVQRKYLMWKYKILAPVAYKKVSRVSRLDRRSNTETVSYRFFLRQYFRPLRKLFYRNNRKVIPEALVDRFDPLVLAVWYMDDGYLDKNNSPLFMTDCYVGEDVYRLVQILKRSVDIQSYVTGNGRLRIERESANKFFRLVEPWVHPSLRYKLP